MATAADLTEAAHLSYGQCDILNTATTLPVEILAFINAASPIFDDSRPNDRPVGNWLVLLTSLQSQMPVGTQTQVVMNTAAEYLFRMCLAGATMVDQGMITNTQATALLAAWNAHIGT